MGSADTKKNYYTTNSGCPIFNPNASLHIGSNLQSTLLFRDINLIENISNITHERIPERVVHAKGAGAYGEFECTSDDIHNYSSADFLSAKGKKTPLFARFSTVAGARGSADTVRDTRGFAFKLYTDEGNLDWLFFSEPVFPIRDGGKFPSFVHAQKGTAQTNIRSPTWFWDFMTRNSESFHAIMMIFSDRGTPKTYRNSDIFGLNTYKFTHAPPHDGAGIPSSFSYVKIHMKPDEGVENMTLKEAIVTAGQDPDFHSRDLFDTIDQAAKGNPEYKFPSWTVSAQIMDPASAETYKYNIFDPTKTWSQDEFPLVPFGKITLNKNVTNYFSEVEQASFSPTAIVPGWDLTADPILQTRLFAYGETARYRLGINFPQFPVNAPKYAYNPTRRDGAGNVSNYGSEPSYVPYVDQAPVVNAKQYEASSHEGWVGRVTAFESAVQDIDYEQPRALWKMFVENKNGQNQAEALVSNVSVDLSRAEKVVRDRAYDVFAKIDADLGARVKAATEPLVPVPVTKKPELPLNGLKIPRGTSVAGGKPDNGQSQTA